MHDCCGNACHGRKNTKLGLALGIAAGLAFTGGLVAAVTSAEAQPATTPAAAPTAELKPVPSDPTLALEKAKRKGDSIPTDAKLKNAKGEEVALSTLLEEGPIVLIFYRGSWCPVCQGSLTKFEAAASDIEAAGGKIYAVTPELVEFLAPTIEKHKYERVHLMSDTDLRLGREFGVVFRNEQYRHLAKFNGNDRLEIPLGVTYIINKDGTIAWEWLDDDYNQRADPAEVIAALKAMNG